MLLVVFIASCSKENKSPEGLKSLITGRWKYITLLQSNYNAKGALTSSTKLTVRSNDYIEFSDKNFTKTLNGGVDVAKGTYTVNSTVKFTLKIGTVSYPCRLLTLSDNDLIFIQEEPKVKGQPYIEYTHTLNR